jgi:hypothetical protein
MGRVLGTWSLAVQSHSSSGEPPVLRGEAFQTPLTVDHPVSGCSRGFETFRSRLGWELFDSETIRHLDLGG